MPALQPALSSLSCMQVDFSVELDRDAPTLEIPWADPDGRLQYHNLKLEPVSLEKIGEAAQLPELREFLAEVNSRDSAFESAKCDVWSTTLLDPDEEIFGEPWKFASYVDLLFSDSVARESFANHELFLKALTASLKSASEISASAEFILRRCFDRRDDRAQEGFYFTTYVFGYGADEAEARDKWSVALRIVGQALRHTSACTAPQNSQT
jgi:hypothetical protein